MWVHRKHLPVMAVTLVAPVLAVAALLALPGPEPAALERCPACGQEARRSDAQDPAPPARSGSSSRPPAE